MNLVKENLRLFIPSIVEFLDDQDFPWGKIERNFNKHIEKRFVQAQNKPITVEANIYDIIIAFKQGRKEFIGLLIYFNRLFDELNKNLDKDSKKIVKTTIKNLLSSYNHSYLNFIGELSVLNNLIKSEMTDLIRCEKPIDNNKSIDFEINFKTNAIKVLIEVINIHLDPQKTEDDPVKIETFLRSKLMKKRNEKTKDSSFEEIVHLIPVLWGSVEDLRIYKQFYMTTGFSLPLTYEAMAYLAYSDDNDYYEHHFNCITKLFKEKSPLPITHNIKE